MPSDKHDKSHTQNLQSLSVTELKHILRSYGRTTKGRKSVLINRIQTHQNQPSLLVTTMAKSNNSRTGDNNTTVRQRKTTNGMHTSPSEVKFHSMTEALEQERKERQRIVLWRRPLLTLQYFVCESFTLASALVNRLYKKKRTVALTVILLTIAYLIYRMEGPHQKVVQSIEKKFLWCAYWVGLGILSSVGLGTGLHTFLLYLGPHIAAVTLAAYECKSVDFPEPPYPTEIVCPEKQGTQQMSLWTIMSKVRLEAVMWGAGTAIGELPPYFMARAARLSGADLEDDEFEEIEELLHEKKRHPEEMISFISSFFVVKSSFLTLLGSCAGIILILELQYWDGFLEKAKLSVHNLVQRVGFFGILACASIPNPLFDLAGITCGHFLIPFWTFFGATLIGKAIIKMHIQKLFVIFMFSAHHVEQVVKFIGYIPHFGPLAQKPFQDYLEKQKLKLHHKPGAGTEEGGGNILSWCFEKLVMVMVIYFVLSIFNSMAQNYHKRLCKEKRTSKKSVH